MVRTADLISFLTVTFGILSTIGNDYGQSFPGLDPAYDFSAQTPSQQEAFGRDLGNQFLSCKTFYLYYSFVRVFERANDCMFGVRAVNSVRKRQSPRAHSSSNSVKTRPIKNPNKLPISVAFEGHNF